MQDEVPIAKRVLIAGGDWGQTGGISDLMRRAFIQLGCWVECFDYKAGPYSEKSRWRQRLPATLRRMLVKATKQEPFLAALPLCDQRFVRVFDQFRPELVLSLKAETLSAGVIEYARSQKAYAINWVFEEPWRTVPESVVPVYDCWAVADRKWQEWLFNHGARQVQDLPLAADPAMHYPAELSESELTHWRSEVCFVGSYSTEREATLAVIAERQLAIWGPGWDLAKNEKVRGCVRSTRRLNREEWLKAFAAAEIVLNIQQQGEYGLSLRVWESLAAGACLLTNHRRDVGAYLEDLVATYDSKEQLVEQVGFLLADEVKRRQMRRSCREYIVAFHSFRHRAETLIDWMQRGTD